MTLETRTKSQPVIRDGKSRISTPKSPSSDSQFVAARTRHKKSAEIAETKARRVRTGCLTCRERHLKCDEALGRCLNCRKSDRVCRRGVRLNFIDIQTVAPPHLIARPHGTNVTFRDDSRFIASEYVGGFERYPPPQSENPVVDSIQAPHEAFEMDPDTLNHLFQSVAHSFDPTGFEVSHVGADLIGGAEHWPSTHLTSGDELLPHALSKFAQKLSMRQVDHAPLADAEQVFLLQVFVEKVGIWMDCMDEMKHFTHILPYHAVDEPMLQNALFACGAKHLALVNASYGEEKGRHFYDSATQDILNAVHDPTRDSVLCATTALVLGIYETMSPRSTCPMNHIAGSRALIRECGWTAKTHGLGGACFWTSVCMELLICLRHNWAVSWNPDTWDVNMDMDHMHNAEQVWLHRMLYICSKIANFRLSVRQLSGADGHAIHTSGLFQEWNLYNSWCDQWAKFVPRSMIPLGYLQPWQNNSKSAFPTVWLISGHAVIARLFYHTARILLAKSHPLGSELHAEMRNMQQTHAYDLCGIVSQVKDRGAVYISVHCLAIAAECLDAREAQDEALGIFDTVTDNEMTWCIDPIKEKLKQTWGWPAPQPHTVSPEQIHNNYSDLDPLLSTKSHDLAGGVVNPLLVAADFALDNHPYQGSYVAPHHAIDHYHYGGYLM
ncbi:uncharacterized protein PFLUO_LOCUS4818 [Penicillium psychrofluorescens]|uniref:uncharacterized protein n=1 Tax=Penicillium psychrofluorescens TaxID=3158075 RepID=UPI003CCD7117